MFSVVIPLFNKRMTVAAAVESVIAQSFEDWELIIVDDGSTDESPKALSHLSDRRISLLRQANAGPGPARNRGIEAARCEWVAFLDADDLWLPCHLEELDRLRLSFPEAGLIGTRYVHSDANGAYRVSPERCDYKRSAIRYFDAVGRGLNLICSSSAAIPKRTYRDFGGFGAVFPGDDSEYWVKIALGSPVAASTRPTVIYRHGTGGVIDNGLNRWTGIKRLEQLSPAVAWLLQHYPDNPSGGLREDLERYIEKYLESCLKTSISIGDVTTARNLRDLYRRRPPPEHRVFLAIASLPARLARLAYWLYLRGQAGLASIGLSVRDGDRR